MAETENKGEASGRQKMDRALSAFSAYLANERNSSAHTVDSYRLDILQFARMMFEADAEEQQVDWNTVRVPISSVFRMKRAFPKLPFCANFPECERSTVSCSGKGWRRATRFSV